MNNYRRVKTFFILELIWYKNQIFCKELERRDDETTTRRRLWMCDARVRWSRRTKRSRTPGKLQRFRCLFGFRKTLGTWLKFLRVSDFNGFDGSNFPAGTPIKGGCGTVVAAAVGLISVSQYHSRSLIIVYLCGTVQSVQFALPFMLCKLANLQTHPFCIHLTRRKHKMSYFFVHKMSLLQFLTSKLRHIFYVIAGWVVLSMSNFSKLPWFANWVIDVRAPGKEAFWGENGTFYGSL